MLLQGKKNIRAQHLDQKNIHSRETLKKKIHAAGKFPPPPPFPITFLMVRPLNARNQKIFGATFCRLTSDLKTCHTILSQKLEEVF